MESRRKVLLYQLMFGGFCETQICVSEMFLEESSWQTSGRCWTSRVRDEVGSTGCLYTLLGCWREWRGTLAYTEFSALGWLWFHQLCQPVALDTPGVRALFISWQNVPLYHTVQLAQRWPPSAAKSGPPAPASGRGKCRQDVLFCGRQVLSHEPLLTLPSTWQGAPPLATRTCACPGTGWQAEEPGQGGVTAIGTAQWGQGMSSEPLNLLQQRLPAPSCSQTCPLSVTGKLRSQRKPVSEKDRNSAIPGSDWDTLAASLSETSGQSARRSLGTSPHPPFTPVASQKLWGEGQALAERQLSGKGKHQTLN